MSRLTDKLIDLVGEWAGRAAVSVVFLLWLAMAARTLFWLYVLTFCNVGSFDGWERDPLKPIWWPF